MLIKEAVNWVENYPALSSVALIINLNKHHDVVEFLQNKPSVSSIVNETVKNIKKVFADNLKSLRFELHKDPEEDKETLFVLIESDLDYEEALLRLEKLEDEYVFTLSSDVLIDLCITVE